MTLLRDRRAAVALMVGAMSPLIVGLTALMIDAGFWIVAQTRLQIAADAAALGTSYLLSNATFKAQTAANQATTAQTVALAEAQGAANKLVGTINTPSVSWPANYSSVTVTLTTQASSPFAHVFSTAAPLLTATATATLKGGASACVLTLEKSGTGIQVDNSGTINAASCPVFSDSASNPSIYLNSGTISGSAIGAVGTVTQSNSGSNTMTPSTPTSNANNQVDPDAGLTAPTPPACDTSNGDYTAYGTYTFTPHGSPATYTFCGNTTFGGNGSTDTFNPGIYYVVNGNLTFNNASLTTSSGITFVMAGSSPGSFSWTNYSNTSTAFTAPTTGPTAGVAIWQVCNSGGGQTSSFQGGSTLVVSGTLYMPCANVDMGNNAQIAAPLNGAMNFIANQLYVHGSAALRTATTSGSGGTGATTAVLSQ